TEQSAADAFGRVAATGVAEQFTDYSAELERYFETRLYSPRPGFCAGLFTDVTDRKRMEEENRALAAVIRRSSDFVGLANIETDAFFVNPAGRAMVGLDSEESVQHTRIMDYFMPEDREFVQNTILPTVMETGRWTGEFRFRHFQTDQPIAVYNDLFLTEDPATGRSTTITTITRDITAEKRIEDARRAGEEKFRTLFNHTNDAIFVHTLTPAGLPGPNVEVNDAACRMLGYTREELLRMSVTDVVPKAAAASIVSDAARLLADGRATFEATNQRRDGTIIPVEVSAYVHAENGEQRVVSVVREISARKAAERELLQFRTITDNALFGCAIAGVDGTLRYVNAAFAAAHGYEPEELIGKDLSVFHTEDQLRVVFAANEELKATGAASIREIGHVHRDGTEFPMLMSGITVNDQHGTPEMLVVSAIDISDRKRSEEALLERETQFRQLFENAPDAVIIADAGTGCIINANSVACRLTGRAIEDLIGRFHNDLHPERIQNDTAQAFMRHTQEDPATAGQDSIESEVVRLDGTIVPVEVKASHVTYEGRPCLMGIFRDISERRESDQKIRALVAEKENLLKEVQHRIKNVMRTMAAMLALQVESTHDASAAASLTDAASRFQSIELLYDQLYRDETHGNGSLSSFLPRLVKGVVDFFGSSVPSVETIVADVQLPEKTLSTVGLIVNELTTNAVKYAFNGRPGGRLSVRGEVVDKAVVITVRDDGPGLPKGAEARTAGGFGLAMVHTLVEQLKGTVSFNQSAGTTVTVAFPLREPR
ncbi:MAG: PAS domain S-box protein, partial [Spirochaetaceae bacterium]